MSAILSQRAAIARQIVEDLAEPWPMPIDPSAFQDDSVYVYDAASKRLVREIGCKSPELCGSPTGVRVAAGQSWARGMVAKRLGLWRAI